MTDNAGKELQSTLPSSDFASALEGAIVGLERLVEEHPGDESAFQRFFEANPVILYGLGFTGYLARPRLPIRPELNRGQFYEPDFLTVRPNSLVEVVDLKTPAERVLLDRARREHFTSKLAEYVSQVQDYREYFSDLDHRAAISTRFGIAAQPNPDALIIVGRDANTDKREVHRQLERTDRSVRVVTFDDVIAELERAYLVAAGPATALPGATVMLMVKFDPYRAGRRRYLFDVQLAAPTSRWSIYLNEAEDLVFEITEEGSGEPRMHAVRVLTMTPGFDPYQWMFVACEFGSSERRTFLRIRIDDRVVAESRYDVALAVGSDLLRIDYRGGYFGSDLNGQQQCNCLLSDLRIYDVALDFRQRLAVVAEYQAPH